jgi:hemolysin III
MIYKKEQTIQEEWFNTISHGLTALTSVGGLVVLIVMGAYSAKDWSLFSALFYGISLVVLYTASALFHGIQQRKTKYIFNIIDHASIFLLIAGTYSPVLLMSIGGAFGWTFFGIQWGLALVGIVLKIFYTGRYEAISIAMYALMGWMIVLKIGYLQEVLPPTGFWLLVSGGLSYTVGIVFYALDSKFRFAHFIWHLFVIAGSLLHYLMIVLYVF